MPKSSDGDAHNYEARVKHLADVIEGSVSEPPTVDLDTELREHCSSLRHVEPGSQLPQLERHVDSMVDYHLEAWRTTARSWAGLREQADRLHNDFNRDRDQIEATIGTRRDRIEVSEGVVRQNEQELERLGREKTTGKPTGNYARMTNRILIIGSLLVGVLTSWIYYTASARIKFLEGGGDLRDFNPVDFLLSDPTNWIYILGVIVFLLAGKIVSLIHSALKHPRWFFLLVASLALAVTFGTVAMIGNVTNQTTQIAQLERRIVDLERDITGGILLGSQVSAEERCSAAGSPAACTDLAEAEATIVNTQNGLSANQTWLTLLALLAEIGLGSVAWMRISEYAERDLPHDQHMRDKIDRVKGVIKGAENEITEAEASIADDKSTLGSISRAIATLEALKTRIPGNAGINDRVRSLKTRGRARAEAILTAMRSEWYREDQVANGSLPSGMGSTSGSGDAT